jgi:hypothetical protein
LLPAKTGMLQKLDLSSVLFFVKLRSIKHDRVGK